jgi:hypothetical protein
MRTPLSVFGLTVLLSGCMVRVPSLPAGIPDSNPSGYGSGFSRAEQARASGFLAEAAMLCARDGGRLWKVSLCGPIAIVDPITGAVATNEPPPALKPPPAFGFSNAAVDWGGRRWTTVMWQQIVLAEELGDGAGYLLMHELFHRIQPQLGLLLPATQNGHLDTIDGRYWMQLEWRALEVALRESGTQRRGAAQDALAFRAARRAAFARAAEDERIAEINEGLAEYTGIAASSRVGDVHAMATRARKRLKWVLDQRTFVHPFGYGSGAAYGVLLELWKPGWTRAFTAADDMSRLLMSVANLQPTSDVATAAARYDGPGLRIAEEHREVERKTRIAELERRFIFGPVLSLPRPHRFTFAGDLTPLGSAGSIYPGFRSEEDWGTLEATEVLVLADGATISVPAPTKTEGLTVSGERWVLRLAPGWRVAPGPRPNDFRLLRTGAPE